MLRKTIISVILSATTLTTLLFPIKANALAEENISAPSAILLESSTGKILFEKKLWRIAFEIEKN